MRLSWLLAFKVFIALFWVLGMIGFISEVIDNRKTFLEILNVHWGLFLIILLGCISVILDFIFKNRHIMIDYFLCIFFYLILFQCFMLCGEYISYLEYRYHWTHLYEFTTNGPTRYIALWFMLVGFALCGLISYFQKNYKRATLCFAFCFVNFVPFSLMSIFMFP